MRRSMVTAAALGVLVVGMAACSGSGSKSAEEEGPVTAETIVGTWVLESGKTGEGEVPLLQGQDIDLTVESDGMFYGFSGCNRITGTLTVDDGKVDMGAIGQTMMMCDEAAMATETAYTSALDAVTQGEATADSLTLSGGSSELHFKRVEGESQSE